jgi:hypothetical protein
VNEDQDIDWNDMAYTVISPSVSTATSSTYTVASPSLAGAVLTTSGTNGTMWANVALDDNLKGASLQVRGDAEFDGDVTIKGKSIGDSLERIEERLAILRPNDELEEKWENLRGLRKLYMELEAEIIEKEKMWSILKK